jgi:hypothetical protein
MSWNYRVVKRLCDVPGGKGKREFEFGIHEVYYNSAGDICVMSENSIAPGGENFNEIRSELNHMLSAFGKPVLDYHAIELAPMNEDDDNTENGVDWNWCDDTYIGSPDFDMKNFDGHVKGTKCC